MPVRPLRRYAAPLALAAALAVSVGGALGGCAGEVPTVTSTDPATLAGVAAAAATASAQSAVASGVSDGAPNSASTSAPTSASNLATRTTSPTTRTTSVVAPKASAVPPAAASAPLGLRVVDAYIPMSQSRLAEMADYSRRHYGTASFALQPSVIVLHFTAGSSWSSARNTFASNAPNVGELPGTCAHYIVDQDGTVYAIVPVTIRCRHTIGLNDQAMGIEMVQPGGPSGSWADQQILARPAQVNAALALVRQLQARYAIPATSVIGHAMANTDPHFHDLLGWRNDHVDWQPGDVAQFRARL